MFSLKLINLVIFDIDNHEKEILAVGYGKKMEIKDKWNQLNLIDTQSVLGTNHHLPLARIFKSYIWLQETNQRINDFSIVYMMNPNLHKNKAFKYQVKECLKNTFGPSTNIHIGKIILKTNTRVLAFVIFYENREKIVRKMFRLLSCVIYTIIGKYVCIDYLGSEK